MKASIIAVAMVLLAVTMMTMSQPLPQLSASSPAEEARPVTPLEQPSEQPAAKDLPAADVIPVIPESNSEQSKPAEPAPKSVEPEIKVAEEHVSVAPSSEPVVEPKAVVIGETEVAGVVAEKSPAAKVEEPVLSVARSEEPEAPKADEATAIPLLIEIEKQPSNPEESKPIGEAISEKAPEAVHNAELISVVAAESIVEPIAPYEKEIVKTAKSDIDPIKNEGADYAKDEIIIPEIKNSDAAPEAESEKKDSLIPEAEPEIKEEKEEKKEDEIVKKEEPEKKEEEKKSIKEEVALEKPKESSKTEELPEAHKLTELPKKPEESKAKPEDSKESSEESSEEEDWNQDKKGSKNEDDSSPESSAEDSEKKAS